VDIEFLDGFRRPKNAIKPGGMHSGTASLVGNMGSNPIGDATNTPIRDR